MRYLPDSAILGTYGRIKHVGRKKRHSTKDYQPLADYLNKMINDFINNKLSKEK
jgi:hypothetical protein